MHCDWENCNATLSNFTSHNSFLPDDIQFPDGFIYRHSTCNVDASEIFSEILVIMFEWLPEPPASTFKQFPDACVACGSPSHLPPTGERNEPRPIHSIEGRRDHSRPGEKDKATELRVTSSFTPLSPRFHQKIGISTIAQGNGPAPTQVKPLAPTDPPMLNPEGGLQEYCCDVVRWVGTIQVAPESCITQLYKPVCATLASEL